jgi:hypothetical protein
MYRRCIRAALALLLVASPAHAGVIGDVYGGVGMDYSLWHARLGLRGGYEATHVGVLAAVDWCNAGGEPGEDTNNDERRVRALVLASVPISNWRVSAGGGAEHERSRTAGFVTPSVAQSFNGYVLQAGTSYLGAIESQSVGFELAIGTSDINGFFVDALVFVRFGH